VSHSPHEPRFQHHGQQVETREAWAARLAAEAAARTRAEEAERLAATMRATAAAAARVRVEEAERLAASRRAAVDRPARAKPRARVRPAHVTLLVFCGVLVILWARTGGEVTPVVAPAAAPAPPKIPAQQTPGSVQGPTHSVPVVDPSPQGWWCLCYKTVFRADHTACRRTNDECEGLRTMIQTSGNSEILQGTASGCRHVRGSHPWDTLGRHDAWRESARRQAVQAIGVCTLD
jgi:hypothetical protein